MISRGFNWVQVSNLFFYLRFTPVGWTYIGIIKFEFVAKTQFLYQERMMTRYSAFKVKPVLLSGGSHRFKVQKFYSQISYFSILQGSFYLSRPPIFLPLLSILNVYAKPILILNLQYTGCLSIMQAAAASDLVLSVSV